MDLCESFIAYDKTGGKEVKNIARNHQLVGVNRALEAVPNRKARAGKLGVFWQTEGSGRSCSMVFFTRKVHRKLGGNCHQLAPSRHLASNLPYLDATSGLDGATELGGDYLAASCVTFKGGRGSPPHAVVFGVIQEMGSVHTSRSMRLWRTAESFVL